MCHVRGILLCHFLFLCLSVRVSLVDGIDVDRFLKKVLASQNFDDIADKIAEKAAEKITHLKIKIKEDSPLGSALNKREPTYRVFENESKYNATISLQTENHKPKRQSSSIRPLFIDYTVTEKDTSVEQEDSATVGGLVLRYKHIMTQNQNHTQTLEKQSNKVHNNIQFSNVERDEHKKIEENPKQLKENVQNGKLKSNNEIPEVNSDAIKEAFEYVLTSVEKVNETTGLVIEELPVVNNITFKSKNNKDNEISESKSESSEPDSLNIEFEKKYKAYVEYKKEKNMSLPNKNIPKEIQDSLNSDEAAANQSSVEETTTAVTLTHNTLAHTRISEGSESQEIVHDETTKTLVRQEGDKYFTFEKSPDYKDYHEKLSLAQKGVEEY